MKQRKERKGKERAKEQMNENKGQPPPSLLLDLVDPLALTGSYCVKS